MKSLRHAPEADDLYCIPIEEVQLPKGSWSKGRVVLIGDAAHALTANGHGYTWGLMGPYILAGEIATLLEKDNSLPVAAVIQGARDYEDKFRPIATVTHGRSHWFESLAFPTWRAGIWILHTIARIAAYFKLEQIGGPGDETSGWELPEYPQLEMQWE
jgi:2-polyprenyl-6-methoxyphenol hydroxylase-like FAD-dependent oxidoreductase